jgi:hypothetical protein
MDHKIFSESLRLNMQKSFQEKADEEVCRHLRMDTELVSGEGFRSDMTNTEGASERRNTMVMEDAAIPVQKVIGRTDKKMTPKLVPAMSS